MKWTDEIEICGFSFRLEDIHEALTQELNRDDWMISPGSDQVGGDAAAFI